MSLPTPPPIGYPVPNARHAISVQMPTWQDMCGMALGESRVKEVQRTGYPRSFIHQDILKVAKACIKSLNSYTDSCLLFPSYNSASACKDFLTSPQHGQLSLLHEAVSAHVMEVAVQDKEMIGTTDREGVRSIYLHAIIYPKAGLKLAMAFWRLTGLGISSRLAEDCLKHIDSLHKATEINIAERSPEQTWTPAHQKICQRIVELLKRSPIRIPRLTELTCSDVYLYQSGMSAIYHVQHLLLKWRGMESVVFGFPYELTLKVLETYGPGCRFYAFGTDDELDQLEAYLEEVSGMGGHVQAIWCECPSNPLLRTSDLDRMRVLADRHGFILVVDETIGSFGNVDVSRVADIIITSLTKSFSGYSDVMGGSVVLNPSAPFYSELKQVFDVSYRNDLYLGDAIHLEINSRDFLTRAAQINNTTSYLVEYFHTLGINPHSTLTAVYYPKICWSVDNYLARMRPSTEDFEAGYGGLFTLEFTTIAAARTFFDAAEMHKGPSLGSNVTLLQPYVQTVFHKEKEWAASCGLKETIVRISVGLEDKEALLTSFKMAMKRVETAMCEGDEGCGSAH